MPKPSDAHPRSSNHPVIGWLLDTDPSIRWQVMRDLTDTPAEIVAADTLHEELAGTVGAPNRWITFRALRLLDWYPRRD